MLQNVQGLGSPGPGLRTIKGEKNESAGCQKKCQTEMFLRFSLSTVIVFQISLDLFDQYLLILKFLLSDILF